MEILEKIMVLFDDSDYEWIIEPGEVGEITSGEVSEIINELME